MFFCLTFPLSCIQYSIFLQPFRKKRILLSFENLKLATFYGSGISEEMQLKPKFVTQFIKSCSTLQKLNLYIIQQCIWTCCKLHLNCNYKPLLVNNLPQHPPRILKKPNRFLKRKRRNRRFLSIVSMYCSVHVIFISFFSWTPKNICYHCPQKARGNILFADMGANSKFFSPPSFLMISLLELWKNCKFEFSLIPNTSQSLLKSNINFK